MDRIDDITLGISVSLAILSVLSIIVYHAAEVANPGNPKAMLKIAVAAACIACMFLGAWALMTALLSH